MDLVDLFQANIVVSEATLTISIQPMDGDFRVTANIDESDEVELAYTQLIMLGLCVLAEAGKRRAQNGTLPHEVFERVEALIREPEKLDH